MWVAPSSRRARHRVDRFAPTVETPPGLIMQNRFQELCTEQESDDEDTCIGDYFDIGGLDIFMPDMVINGVGRTAMLVSVGRGKVTIDSGAAESVMPRDMLQHETLVEGAPKKSGVKYVAANGAKMDNNGEKRVRFKEEGLNGINSMVFQVTDVGKPLASVSRILDKWNSVVFSRGPKGSYVVNIKLGAGFRWWRREERLSWRSSTCSRTQTETRVLPGRALETGRHACWPGLARKTRGGVPSG